MTYGEGFDSGELRKAVKRFRPPTVEEAKQRIENGIRKEIMRLFVKAFPTPELRKANMAKYNKALKDAGIRRP